MNSTPFPQSLKCRTLALLMSPILATVPASAGVIFSASFETPVVSGFASNTVPTTGWVGATAGFGASNRGLYNETVAWPTTPVFTTPYGAQAYCINYTNSGLTTAVGATGQTLTADVTYKVSFNAAVTSGTAPGGITGVAPATLNLPVGWAATVSKVGTDLVLNVTSTGGGNAYSDWISTYPGAAAFPGFTQDADGDGIKNGVENFFGSNPGVFSSGLIAGTKSGNTFTFTHPQNATPGSDLSAVYRWSKDLATFNTSGATDSAGTTVSFNAVTNLGITTVTVTATVTVTVTGTATTKLLVDVKVTQN